MDADAPRTRSSTTASMPDLRLHDPGQDLEQVAVRFPRLSTRHALVAPPQQQAKVVLGTTQKKQAELDRIQPGNVIVLDQPADSPMAMIWQEEIVAWVDLVKLDGVNVWKVVELASAESKEVADD